MDLGARQNKDTVHTISHQVHTILHQVHNTMQLIGTILYRYLTLAYILHNKPLYSTLSPRDMISGQLSDCK